MYGFLTLGLVAATNQWMFAANADHYLANEDCIPLSEFLAVAKVSGSIAQKREEGEKKKTALTVVKATPAAFGAALSAAEIAAKAATYYQSGSTSSSVSSSAAASSAALVTTTAQSALQAVAAKEASAKSADNFGLVQCYGNVVNNRTIIPTRSVECRYIGLSNPITGKQLIASAHAIFEQPLGTLRGHFMIPKLHRNAPVTGCLVIDFVRGEISSEQVFNPSDPEIEQIMLCDDTHYALSADYYADNCELRAEVDKTYNIEQDANYQSALKFTSLEREKAVSFKKMIASSKINPKNAFLIRLPKK